MGSGITRGTTRGAAALAALALLWGSAAAAGNLTSGAELRAVRIAAEAGVAPHVSDREQLLIDARRPWSWGSVSGEYVTTESGGTKRCHPVGNAAAAPYLVNAASDAYAMAIGAHLAPDLALAEQARSRVLDLVDTHGFHGLTGDYSGSNQCILELSVSMPVWIETAMLLEETAAWSAEEGAAFRSWLAGEVFPKVAWASRKRRNNWGAAGSTAAYVIARYVDGAVAELHEHSPDALSFTPLAAAASHAEMQGRRIRNEWVGDSRCDALGVQWHGGIPEELRRGSTGCDGSYLLDDDRSLSYQTMHAQLLVLHAEAMRAHGDTSLYDLTLPGGAPALLQAIRFVIDNPAGGPSWGWGDSRQGALNVAVTWYEHDSALRDATRSAGTFRGGLTLPYTRLTHLGIASPVEPEVPLGQPGRPRVID